jgi:ketosteroid isomerase-like protein
MKMPNRIASALAACLALVLAAAPARADDTAAIGRAALDAYVAAINSNDVETLMASLTDDVVYQPPNAPELVGKAAVRAMIAGYYAGYKGHWEKTAIGFTVNGDWAFQRFTYTSRNTDRKTGAVVTDTGKGLVIFRRGADGIWRVAIDGWSSDQPVPAAGR